MRAQLEPVLWLAVHVGIDLRVPVDFLDFLNIRAAIIVVLLQNVANRVVIYLILVRQFTGMHLVNGVVVENIHPFLVSYLLITLLIPLSARRSCPLILRNPRLCLNSQAFRYLSNVVKAHL